MIIRATDTQGDWTFGQGRSNYKSELLALTQWINEVLQIWLNDLFYDAGTGIDWFNVLSGQFNEEKEALDFIEQDVRSVVLLQQKYGVIGVRRVKLDYNRYTRELLLDYEIDTVYGIISSVGLLLEFYGVV